MKIVRILVRGRLVGFLIKIFGRKFIKRGIEKNLDNLKFGYC